MDEVGTIDVPEHLQVRPEGLHGGVRSGQSRGHAVGAHARPVVVGGALRAETVDVQIHLTGQHAAQLRNMDTCPAIDFWGEFLGDNIYSHSPNVVQEAAVL